MSFQQVQYEIGINSDFEVVVVLSDLKNPDDFIKMTMPSSIAEKLAEALINKVAEIEEMEDQIKDAIEKLTGEIA